MATTIKASGNGDFRCTKLNSQVSDLISRSTWWELHGKDFALLCYGALSVPFGYYLTGSDGFFLSTVGVVILATVHQLFVTKAAHSATHNSISPWPKVNRFLGVLTIEFMGGFTFDGGKEIHVKTHHPHTNVIGLGDSSAWRAPFLGRTAYMITVPFLLPFVAPALAISTLWGQWSRLAWNLLFITIGAVAYIAGFYYFSNLTLFWSCICAFIVRSLYYIPYIHVNIFQHIGLPMFSNQNRPPRLALMSYGVLNLDRNLFLDIFFGHSLVNCHIEHHLFPNLSDTMCMKIKPLVKAFLKEKGLPYQEDSYSNRFRMFWNDYATLMVNQPAITSFIGVQ